jgi:hypothetical protein
MFGHDVDVVLGSRQLLNDLYGRGIILAAGPGRTFPTGIAAAGLLVNHTVDLLK